MVSVVYLKLFWRFIEAGVRFFLCWVFWGVIISIDWDENCIDMGNIDIITFRFRAKCCIMFRIKLIY